ncbi:hypothetical protein KBU53_13315 [Enterobacter hormaechei subsp. xiangfangensis]|uniref:hypothetical protein n=1 Tax=Enterobacter hormaechei TaxID=158836 RepID=UPI001A14712E|nr:hypothetical protein [Enterobacter hormaechei]EKY1421909.1 hypothetical protein [Enterobacter hormaechei]MDR9942068.1 hypothetical protein [Enterobacter hormaechei subsp. xiangfangensis]
MNNKELINAGHALAKAISNDTPLIEIAKMVSNLATQLDVQIARSNQLSIALEAAEKRVAEQRELLQWAHDTLIEINPNNYTHDDVCEINNASVKVILGIAPVLGETHGKSEEWWAARAAGTAKGE